MLQHAHNTFRSGRGAHKFANVKYDFGTDASTDTDVNVNASATHDKAKADADANANAKFNAKLKCEQTNNEANHLAKRFPLDGLAEDTGEEPVL